jgi:hypothetical protein
MKLKSTWFWTLPFFTSRNNNIETAKEASIVALPISPDADFAR